MGFVMFKLRTTVIVLMTAVVFIFFVNCKNSSFETAILNQDPSSLPVSTPPAPPLNLKMYPSGLFVSVGGAKTSDDDMIGIYTNKTVTGVLISVPWNLCDQNCLLDFIDRQLTKAEANGLKISLTVMDGMNAPDTLKAKCSAFSFDFRGIPATMCLPWNAEYLIEKKNLIAALGQRFDSRSGLAYMYFTGACSSNGNEGHCRVDQAAYTSAGYTNAKLIDAYTQVMTAYLSAFPTTPIAFEAHAIFDSPEPWQSLWQAFKASGRVGIASWWCAERLSIIGNETALVWPLFLEAAQQTFTICQTVGSLTNTPYRFSEPSLGLNYGTETAWTNTDSLNAFTDLMDWIEGKAVHAGQINVIPRYKVMEPWHSEVKNSAFAERLQQFRK